MKNKLIATVVLLVFVLMPALAQFSQLSQVTFDRPTADTQFARPLKDVLDDIEARFQIKLNRPKELDQTQMVPYADYRIAPWSVEESLNNVLAMFDFKAVLNGAPGRYKISQYEYMRHTPEYGEKFIAYLNTLYDDKESFEARRAELQGQLRHLAGLDSLPERPNSKPYLTPKRVYGDYYVQNIGLEILPGVYCTGSIYHPTKFKKGSCPVILNPNGHFGDGRYRKDEQLRCAMQARMGCIAVSYDLFAWDEQLLQFESRSHRTAMAHTIQNLNAIRLLDYLLTLKEADKTRVGITGGSGGGSATMFLTAIDDRITLSMPVVMTTSYFLGGCPCESGNPVHLAGGGTNNSELTALCAPRPLLVVSDGGDWTATVPQITFPYLQRVYGFYGAEDKLENAHFPREGHDYGWSKREATYKFLEKHWKLDTSKVKDSEGKFDESACTVEEYKLLKVWGENGENLPANAVKGIENLYRMFKEYGK